MSKLSWIATPSEEVGGQLDIKDADGNLVFVLDLWVHPEKNVPLLLAAPDLYEACKEAETVIWLMVAAMDEGELRGEATNIYHHVKVALAKADKE